MEGQRYGALEGARGFFALWVFVGHSLQQSGIASDQLCWPLTALRSPGLAVDCFMILSGFVIANLILTKRESFSVYIVRRWFRLVPLFAACIAFILVFTLLLNDGTYIWNRSLTWEYLSAYTTLLHGAIPTEILERAPKAILPVGWSISLEWQFYLIAPALLLHASRRTSGIAICALAVASLFLNRDVLQEATGLTFRSGFLPLHFHWFALGMLSYLVFEKFRPCLAIPAWSVLGAVLVVITTGSFVLGAWLLLAGALCGDRIAERLFTNGPALFIGGISYSIYLTHMVVMVPVRKLLIQSLLDVPFGSWEHWVLNVLITLPCMLLASYWAWRLIERPGIQLGSRLAKQLECAAHKTAPA